MSNTAFPPSGHKTARGAALAAAMVAGAGLFFEPAALAPSEQAAVEQLLAHADARVVGEASSCCLPTPPESR